MLTLREAADAFITGFVQVRCRTKPFVAQTFGELTVMRDPIGTRRPRSSEAVFVETPVAEAVALIRAQVQERHAVCAIRPESSCPLSARDDWRSAGYRLRAREGIFALGLSVTDPIESPTLRVENADEARRLARAMGSKRDGAKLLSVPGLRLSVLGRGKPRWDGSGRCGAGTACATCLPLRSCPSFAVEGLVAPDARGFGGGRSKR